VRRVHPLLAAILLCGCLPATAHATQRVRLDATLTPERLGQGTTVGFGFQIAAPPGRVPPPLTSIDVRYPRDLGIALSGLGLATCSQAFLEGAERGECPPNSRMGYGSALAEIPIGPLILRERASIAVFRAPTREGHLALLFYAAGKSPVSTEIVFPGLLLPTPGTFGGDISMNIPLVPSLPGAPDVAVVRLSSTIGPQHLTYYEHIRGRTIAYRPKGIMLPNACPRGGFRFSASFSFEDGSHTTANHSVPCPTS
jgi:hypothetical protein